jgi:hypothetical protein
LHVLSTIYRDISASEEGRLIRAEIDDKASRFAEAPKGIARLKLLRYPSFSASVVDVPFEPLSRSAF